MRMIKKVIFIIIDKYISLSKIKLYTYLWRVKSIIEKMVETQLRWFGHAKRRPVDYVARRIYQTERVVKSLEVEGDLEKL